MKPNLHKSVSPHTLDLLPGEEARPIDMPELKDYYLVTNHGRVISVAGAKPKFLKPIKHNRGYLQVNLARVEGSQRAYLVHRLVCYAFLGPHLAGQEVNHIDHVKTNNRLDNLEYCSPSANILAAVAAGKFKGGRPQGKKSLSTEAMLEVYQLRNSGRTQTDVAKDFGINATRVGQIWRGFAIKSIDHLTQLGTQAFDCDLPAAQALAKAESKPVKIREQRPRKIRRIPEWLAN